MTLWQKPMSSYKKIFPLGIWPFLQIKAKHKDQFKNVSDQKTDSTLFYQLFKTRNFVNRPNMHFLTIFNILIMGDDFFMNVRPIDKVSSFEKLI